MIFHPAFGFVAYGEGRVTTAERAQGVDLSAILSLAAAIAITLNTMIKLSMIRSDTE